MFKMEVSGAYLARIGRACHHPFGLMARGAAGRHNRAAAAARPYTGSRTIRRRRVRLSASEATQLSIVAPT